MDIKLSEKQIMQFSRVLSINDVLNCIIKNYENYIKFLNNELNNNELTELEYKKELNLIEQLKQKELEELKI